MSTCQQIVDKARETGLNDADKVRYPDDRLMRFLQDAVNLAYSMRPDLRFGAFGTTPAALNPASTFPLPPQHEAVVSDYIIGRAETSDDENVNADRERKALEMFGNGMKSA